MDYWARHLLKSMEWAKTKGTTRKVEPSEKILRKKISYKRKISRVVLRHDSPLHLILNLDKTPLPYVSLGKYTIYLKGSSTVPIKDVDAKDQITAKFTVSATGIFLLVQLIYQGTTERTSQIQFSKTVQRYVCKEPLVQSRKMCRSIWKNFIAISTSKKDWTWISVKTIFTYHYGYF